MATDKQLEAVSLLIENHGMSKGEAMRQAGYTEASAKNPKNLTDSKAYSDLMEAYLPDDMLLRALSDDIESKVGNRKAELELGFKLKGRMTERVDVTTDGQALNTITEEEKAKLLSLLD